MAAAFTKSFLSFILLIVFSSWQRFDQPEMKAFDEPLYRLMLEQVESNGLWENRRQPVEIRVDPRPLEKSRAFLEELAFAQIEESELERYIQLIIEFEVIPADIEEDYICEGTGGMPPPPRPGEPYEPPVIPEHCKEIGRNFVTIAFAVPRLEKETASREGNVEGIKLRYVVRAVEISSYTIAIYDLVFDLKEDHRWEFIQKEEIFMVMS